jgi:hypothetical protein
MKIAILALLLVAACGKLGALQPVTPDKTPPRPLNALVPPTPEQQLVLPTQSAPDRVDDPIKKSRERTDDRFDLPPPG